MNFIVDNYIWFIVAGFVLLMITIGYYAEKTNFGKKQTNEIDSNNADEIPKIPEDKKRLLDVTSISQITGNQILANTAVPEVTVNKQVVEEPSIDIVNVFDIPNVQQENNERPIQIPNIESNTNINANMNNNSFSDGDVWKF